ncbi:BamA/TamA family outer membrane protein [Flammeovirgaceae bacterium SG7u.111]|nr:BamA/TamA family outer membrane protein [Flammeovirgaceae bacterium SG7u.132]WPO33149.1 BamA/TamA family outer membrane protein [Flammeovirgaceae bacterium SG7u.111]
MNFEKSEGILFVPVLLLLLVAAFECKGEEWLAEGDTVTKVKKENIWRKGNIVPLPVAFYSPETQLAFGAVLMNFFKLNKNDTISRTSNARTALIYTTRNQFITNSDYNIFFKEEAYQLRGSISFLKFPDNYYGIGNDTDLGNEEVYENNIFNFSTRFTKNLGKGLFVGLQYNYYNMFNIKPEEGGELADLNILGSEGVSLSGLGFIMTYDRRDNTLNASKGMYLEISNRFYSSVLGSSHDFNEVKIDVRKYFKIASKHVVALQSLGNFNTGSVPFQKMGYLGGDKLLRGYYRGRYRDKNALALQAEYRYSVCPRFGVVVFGGVGQVAASPSNFTLDRMKESWGAGLRFTLNKKESLNLRVDYGMGRDVSNFYINLAEAF